MGLFDRFASFFDDWSTGSSVSPSVMDDPATINPATGLPMTGGMGGVDVAGNPFGSDFSAHRHDDWHHDTLGTSSTFDDHASRWHDSASWSSIGGGHDPWRD